MPPSGLRARALKDKVDVPESTLADLRAAVAKARDLELQKADQEAALEATKEALNKLYQKELVDLLDQAGVPEITISAEGNLPAYTAKAQPYYHANIAADWEEERRNAAFQWLDDNGHGGLIKTMVTLFFPREDRASARKFVKYAQNHGLTAKVEQGIPWSTLTAWLKDMVENKKTIPPLDTLGGQVGRVVTLKSKDK